MMRLWPTSIVGRTVFVLLVGLAVTNLVGFALYWTERMQTLTASRTAQVVDRVVSLTEIVDETPVSTRPSFVREVRAAGLRMVWTRDSALAERGRRDAWADGVRAAVSESLGDDTGRRVLVTVMRLADLVDVVEVHRMMPDMLGRRTPGMGRPGGVDRNTTGFGRRFGSDAAAPQPGSDETAVVVSVALADASWLNFIMPAPRARPFWESSVFLPMLGAMGVVIALSVWAVWRATAPLALFTGAAERLGRDVNAPALDEKGPREVRSAARAFNEMQRRLRTFVGDRTRMLAAISHDLRTPITRMRLRAEFVEDAEQRRKMLIDLDEMEAMIAATLSFAREDAAGEGRVRIDLVDLLREQCDARAGIGQAVEFTGSGSVMVTGAPTGFKRAIGNLIDNAVNYGKVARVALETAADEVVVTVEDDGPGIPESELERVFDAFYRIEHSRSRETGGVGLGLSVVRTIVRAHGGEATLENRPEGGLRAVVTLPRD